MLYAGTTGVLDDLPLKQVGEFERALIEYVNDSHPEVAEQITSAEKDIPDETKAVLDGAITAVKAQIQA